MISTVLSCFSLLLLLIGYTISPDEKYISLSANFHVSILNDGLDSRIVCFNDANAGPYRGSLVGFAGDDYPHTTAFGSSAGIYYRHFEWPDTTLWTLMISLWYPIAVSALLPTRYLIRRSRHQSQSLPPC